MAAKWQQWMPLYVDRFRGSASVQAMHPAARAGYLYLLLDAWQTDDCTISPDPVDLSERSGLGKKLWATHGSCILRKFDAVTVTVGDTVTERLRNEAEFKEWSEAKRVYESRHNAALRTNTERSPKRSPHTTEERSPSRSADTRTGTVTGTETETETRGTPPSAPLGLAPANPEPLEPPPFDAEPEDNIPDGLAPMQYAHFVLTEAAIPAGYALKVKTGDAIEMLARLESCGMAKATKRLLDRMRAAQARGDKVNGFWLEDGHWKAGAAHTPTGNAAAAREAFLAEVEA